MSEKGKELMKEVGKREKLRKEVWKRSRSGGKREKNSEKVKKERIP